MNIEPIEWKISASFDDGSHMVTFPAINKGILLLKKPEMADIESLIGLVEAARDAQVQAALAEQEPVAMHDSDCSTNNRGVPELLGPCDCSHQTRSAFEDFANRRYAPKGYQPERDGEGYKADSWQLAWEAWSEASREMDDMRRAYELLFKENARLRSAQPEPSTPAAQERAEPVAPAVGEREAFEAEFPIPEGMVYWDGDKYGVLPAYENSYRADRYCGQWLAWQARAALATKPQAVQEATPPAQTVQDSAYPSDVEIAVPPIGSEWGHTNGDTYTVTGYADMFSDSHQRRPPRIIYRSAKTGRVWSREHTDWYRSMKPLSAARTRGDEVGKS